MKIGSVELNTHLALGPMAGVTDLAFRQVCRELSGCYTVSEMVSAKALCYGDKKTPALLKLGEGEHPAAVQIFGCDEPFLEKGAALALERSGADIIDINMGCPMGKIVNNGDGAALMKDPQKAGRIVEAVVRAVPVPVTAKFRRGWDMGSCNCVEFARILSGNSRAGELLGELQQDTSMFRYDDLHRCHFWPVFRQFLLWQQEREYSAEEQNWLYGRAALYYELHDNYKNALDCYTRCGEYQKVSELLIKNSEVHPGLAHYDEMEDYYRALPREQVLSSPALMAGMSMLSSICMDYDASEAWYLELERCAGRLKRSDADYKSVRGWLAYLDIALPQRSVGDILSKLTNVVSLLSSKEIVMPEFSVTSRLPSIMNGGKDFCAWSREDDDLYRKYRIPVSFLLKRDGVALPECAIAESKFEKGEEISGRMLDLLGRLEKIQKKGTPDIEFALIGLLVRLRIDQGEADRAIEHLEALRERFQRPDCQRFLPNLDALMCRIAMYQGNDEAVDTWYREKAPRDLLKLRVMLRYQYLTRAMVEIVYGKYQEALLVMAPLRPYFKAAHRVMDGIYLDLLTALCQFRSGDGGWQASLRAALDTCRDYQFIRPVSQYGAAILPLLEKGGWTADPAFLDRLTAAARKQAAQYPDFLRFRGDLPEPLSPAEMNVLRLLCHHKSNAEIGEILGIKLPTVKTYVSAVLRKLDVKNRGAVKDAALKLHLI